jgi:endogenous inhibitor of DNA gyrase (YacG/DUF329 family)
LDFKGCQVVKICIICGKEFSQVNKGQKFCSRACYTEAHKRTEKICPHCGEKFVPSRTYSEYCSFGCFNEQRKRRVQLICPECGKTFTRTESAVQNAETHFCSVGCYQKSTIVKSNLDGKDRIPSDKTRLKMSIARTGKKLPPHNEETKEQISASLVKYHAENGHCLSFEPYSQDWKKTLKRSIRERDNQTCQLCGKIWMPGTNRFHVHHIDYDKKNCGPKNLTTLCIYCHMITNHDRDLWPGVFEAQSALNQNQWTMEIVSPQVGV